jgi:predicted AlkP superfamily phosphohydrolase/phosphomutase
MATVIFGLDGADPNLIEKWMTDLPNFRKLKEEGFFGDFKTTEPPITVPAWMCIFSGKNPSDFDAYDFRSPDFQDYSVDITDSSHFRGKSLIDSTKNVISFRVPGTTPKYSIDGSMVSGFIQGEELNFEPESLREEIEREVDVDLREMKGSREEKREVANNNFKVNFGVYRYLLENKDFDTAFSVFRLIDTHMHNVDEERSLKEVYELADDYVGEIIDFIEKHDHDLIVLSDHGSMQTDRKLYLNNVLRKSGFLRYREEESSTKRKVEEKVGSMLVNLGLKTQVKKILSFYSDLTGKDPQHTQSTILPALDKDRTEAFCYISGVSKYGVIWIHDNRFNEGIIEQDQKEEKAEEVMTSLRNKEFIENVSRPADFKQNEKIPDILVEAKEGVVIGAEPYNVNFHKTSAAVHDERGLLAGIGENFYEGKKVEADYKDIAPTIQALNGKVDISTGNILENILKDINYSRELRNLDI